MRILKQAVLTMALLVLALLALSLVRLGRVPAQVPPQVALGNGDVDCDGEINITDPLVLLNWLFGEGPEPCAIAQAQPDACCTELREEVANLRSMVDVLSRRVPSPRDLLHLTGTLPFPPQGAERTAYTVPDDKWFVLTYAEFGGSDPPVLLSKVDGQSQAIPYRLTRDGGQTWATGRPLPPGTELIVSHPQPYCSNPCPFNITFYLQGYLVSE